MKSSISCQLSAIVADVKVRQTTQHARDFISLRVNLLDDPDGKDPLWVSTFHDVPALKDALQSGQRVKIEGKVKLHRYTDAGGVERSLLKIDADEIALVLTGAEKEAAKAKAKQKEAEKQAAKAAQPTLELGDDGLKSAAGLYQGPAPPQSGKTYEWHDKGGDEIADLF